MASPFRSTYEYLINSWLPIASNVVEGQLHQPQQQLQQPQRQLQQPYQQLQQPQQLLSPTPQVASCVVMQPCYVPSQQPLYQPKQTNNNSQMPTYSAYQAQAYPVNQSSVFPPPHSPAYTTGPPPAYPACPQQAYPAVPQQAYPVGQSPAYAACQSPVYPTGQSPAYHAGQSHDYLPRQSTNSQMFVMTPINSIHTVASSARDANVTANAKTPAAVGRYKTGSRGTTHLRGTRTVSCTATLPRRGKPKLHGSCPPQSRSDCSCPGPCVCKDCACSNKNSDLGSTLDDTRPRPRPRPRHVTHLHLNILKTPSPPKVMTGRSSYMVPRPSHARFRNHEDTDDVSCSSDESCSTDEYDRWTTDNKTNNNTSRGSALTDLPERTNCHNHASCNHCVITTLVPKKSRKTAHKKTLETSTRAARQDNKNNANNNRRRSQPRKKDIYIKNEARRIGAELAGMAQSLKNRRITQNPGKEWYMDDRGTPIPKRRLVAPHTLTDYKRDYTDNVARRIGKYQTPTHGNGERDADGLYNNPQWSTKESDYTMTSEAVEDGNSHYSNSADYDQKQVTFAPDPGGAQRISRRDTTVSRRPNVTASSATPSLSGDNVDDDKQLQTAMAMQISVFVTAVCYSLHISCLERLEEDLLTDRTTYQQIQHTVSVIQFFVSYMFGRYCDISGLYTAFFVTYLTSALSYSLLSLAQDDYLIFASRIITVFVHNVEAGQIAICQTGSAQSRVIMLGKVALANGLGMRVAGIFTDTLINRFGAQDLTLILSGVQCTGLLILLLTKFHGAFDRLPYQERVLEKMLSPYWIQELLASPRLLHLLMAQFCSSLAVYVFQGAFPQMAISYFHMNKDQLGMCLTYVALMTLATQSVGVNLIMGQVKEEKLTLTLSLILTVIYFLLMLVPNALYVWMLMFPLSVAVTLLNLMLTSALSACGPPNSIGSTLGLNMMVVLLSKAMASVIIGAVTSQSNFADVAVLGLACSGITSLLLFHDNNAK